MGEPRGRKSTEAATASSGGEEGAAPTDKIKRGRPRRHVSEDDDAADEVEDTVKAEEGEDSVTVKPVVPSKDDVDPKSLAVGESNGGKKRPRRLQRRQVKRSSGSAEEDDKDDSGDRARAKSNGFRRNSSRRKSTPGERPRPEWSVLGFISSQAK